MRKVLCINGSPRKKWNTGLLLANAMQGAESVGAQTRLINLYELDFRGCISCFACKRLKDPADICIVRDDLRPVLEEAMQADAIIMGSPIYFSDVSSALRAFWERLLFMNATYDTNEPSKFGGSIASGVIYTMNVQDKMLESLGYGAMFQKNQATLSLLLKGHSEYLAATDTLQFLDYSLYMGNRFDPEHKARMRAEKFPDDLQAAWELGARLALS